MWEVSYLKKNRRKGAKWKWERIRDDVGHFWRNVEVLLGNVAEININIGEILAETDRTIDECKKGNKDLQKKMWKAIRG